MTDTVSVFLENYSGKDKVLRTLAYGSMYLSSLTQNGKISAKLLNFSSQMSQCRTVLRLFDDIPMLSRTLTYGLGNEEKDKVLRFLGLVGNFLGQLYYPLEHVAWAADHNLIAADSSVWWHRATVVWALSLYTSIAGAIRCIVVMQAQKKFASFRGDVGLLRKNQIYEVLSIIQYSMDLCIAINSFPKGFLWSSKLKRHHIGLTGFLSSLIILYKTVAQTR